MKEKYFRCDDCIYNCTSNETEVGAGFVPFCRKAHWDTEGDPGEERNYDTWDNCEDFKPITGVD